MELAQKLMISGVEIQGPTGFNPKFTNLSSVVTTAIPYIFWIAGIILLAYLVWGGFEYLVSMGDPKKAESAKGKITNAILGFVLIFVAYWLVQIIDYIFKLGVYNPVP